MKTIKILSYAAFTIYIILLIWIILFKLGFPQDVRGVWRSLNLIPFYYKNDVGARLHFKEVFENVLIFVPMGVFLKMLCGKSGNGRIILAAVSASFALETAQFIFSIGAADITDIITNSLGAFLGTALYGAGGRILGERVRTVFTISALLCEGAIISVISVIFTANI